MNRVPQETSHPDNGRSADSGAWVSPTHASPSRHTSWRDLFAAIWPVYRAILLGCVGSAALLALALVWYRQWAVGVASDVLAGPACRAGVTPDDFDCLNALSQAPSDLFRVLGMLFVPTLPALATAGAILLGVSAFARDYEQRTQVFLLTQSVSRARWWAAKTLLVLVPWALAMLGLGASTSWALNGVAAAVSPLGGQQGPPMSPSAFYLSALGLSTIGVVAVCAGVTAGILLRSAIGALVLAGLVIAALVGGAEVARPHLVPVDRAVSAYEGSGWTTVPDDSWIRDNGFLDANGSEVGWTADCSDLYTDVNEGTISDESTRQCATRNGIVYSFTTSSSPRGSVCSASCGRGCLSLRPRCCLSVASCASAAVSCDEPPAAPGDRESGA